MILLCPPEKSTQFHYPLDPKKILAEGSMHKDTTYQGSDRQDFHRHGKEKKKTNKKNKNKKKNKQTKRRPEIYLFSDWVCNPVKKLTRKWLTRPLPVKVSTKRVCKNQPFNFDYLFSFQVMVKRDSEVNCHRKDLPLIRNFYVIVLGPIR